MSEKMVSDSVKAALQRTIRHLQLEEIGEVKRETIDIPKGKKKATAFMTNAKAPLPPSKSTQTSEANEKLEKLTSLLQASSEKKGYPISDKYAREKLQDTDFKLVAALNAVKLDLDTREAAYAKVGSKPYHGFDKNFRRNRWAGMKVPDEKIEWKRDVLIQWLEHEESWYVWLYSMGEDYAKNPGRGIDKNWCSNLMMYYKEAQMRETRRETFQHKFSQGLSPEDFERCMEMYDAMVEEVIFSSGDDLEHLYSDSSDSDSNDEITMSTEAGRKKIQYLIDLASKEMISVDNKALIGFLPLEKPVSLAHRKKDKISNVKDEVYSTNESIDLLGSVLQHLQVMSVRKKTQIAISIAIYNQDNPDSQMPDNLVKMIMTGKGCPRLRRDYIYERGKQNIEAGITTQAEEDIKAAQYEKDMDAMLTEENNKMDQIQKQRLSGTGGPKREKLPTAPVDYLVLDPYFMRQLGLQLLNSKTFEDLLPSAVKETITREDIKHRERREIIKKARKQRLSESQQTQKHQANLLFPEDMTANADNDLRKKLAHRLVQGALTREEQTVDALAAMSLQSSQPDQDNKVELATGSPPESNEEAYYSAEESETSSVFEREAIQAVQESESIRAYMLGETGIDRVDWTTEEMNNVLLVAGQGVAVPKQNGESSKLHVESEADSKVQDEDQVENGEEVETDHESEVSYSGKGKGPAVYNKQLYNAGTAPIVENQTIPKVVGSQSTSGQASSANACPKKLEEGVRKPTSATITQANSAAPIPSSYGNVNLTVGADFMHLWNEKYPGEVITDFPGAWLSDTLSAPARKLFWDLAVIHKEVAGCNVAYERPDRASVVHLVAMSQTIKPISLDEIAGNLIRFCGGSAALAVRFWEEAVPRLARAFAEEGVINPNELKFLLRTMQFLDAFLVGRKKMLKSRLAGIVAAGSAAVQTRAAKRAAERLAKKQEKAASAAKPKKK